MIRFSETGQLKITQSIIAVEKDILVYRNTVGGSLTTIRGNDVHFDVVLLFALISAVPHVNRKRRMKIFLLGFAIVFILHLLKIFIFVKTDYSLSLTIGGVPYSSPFERKAYQYLRGFIYLVVNQILPVVIWSLLYAKYWWRKALKLGSP
jgi:hypothetical protein